MQTRSEVGVGAVLWNSDEELQVRSEVQTLSDDTVGARDSNCSRAVQFVRGAHALSEVRVGAAVWKVPAGQEAVMFLQMRSEVSVGCAASNCVALQEERALQTADEVGVGGTATNSVQTLQYSHTTIASVV